MAKKYYWLKLQNDFFTQKEIKKLRKIAGGDTYTIIYLKLQLLSLRNEGKLFFEGIEDNFTEEIALELDEDVENVKFTLMFLQKYKLIEEVTENEFLLPETIKNIGSETDAAARVRKCRERKNLLLCNGNETNSNTEKRREDIELDKDIDIELKKDNIPWKKLLEAWNNLPDPIKSIKAITKNRQDKIKARINSLKLDIDTILTAIENIKNSDFCQGKSSNNWIIDFDWLFKNDTNFSKVLEGKYNNKTNNNITDDWRQ